MITGMNVVIANRQRKKKINTPALKQIVGALLAELELEQVDLGINLVSAREMTLVNETFLQHEGPTDVITFDHEEMRETENGKRKTIHGELFVCVDVAGVQAKEFKAKWQSEVVRYIVHGVLHLLGHDDLKPQMRRKMKRAENRLVRRLQQEFLFAQLSRTAKISA